MNHARAPVGKEPVNHARAPVGKEPLVRGITKGTLGAWDTGARAWFMGFLVRAQYARIWCPRSMRSFPTMNVSVC